MNENKQQICDECKGSRYKGVSAPSVEKDEFLNSENLVLKTCTRCGGSGLLDFVIKPDDSSYTPGQGNIIDNN